MLMENLAIKRAAWLGSISALITAQTSIDSFRKCTDEERRR